MRQDDGPGKAIALHAAVIALLFGLNFILPEYHHGVLARVMVLAVFAMGYNLLFGYVGLLFATLWGVLFFGEMPDAWTGLGAAIIVAAGLYVWHRETVAARKVAA